MTRANNSKGKHRLSVIRVAITVVIAGFVLLICFYGIERHKQVNTHQVTALPTTINASDADSGKILTLQLGQTLKITLPNTGWAISNPSNQTVLSHRKTTVLQPNQKQPEGETILSYLGSNIGQSSISAMVTIRPDCVGTHLMCPQIIRSERFQLTIQVIPLKR